MSLIAEGIFITFQQTDNDKFLVRVAGIVLAVTRFFIPEIDLYIIVGPGFAFNRREVLMVQLDESEFAIGGIFKTRFCD